MEIKKNRTREARTRLRRLAASVWLLAALPAAAQSTAGEPASAPASDLWYVVTIAGRPVGSVHERVTDEAGTVRVDDRSHIVLNRMGSRVEMEIAEASRETRDGHLLGLDVDLRLSSQATASQVTVEAGVVRVRDRAGDRSFERTVAFSGELVGPEGLRRRSAAGLVKPGDRIEVQTWAAELGAVRKLTRTAVSAQTVATPGGPVRALRVDEEMAGNPTKRTLWLDADGRLVQSSDAGPLGEMQSVRADEAAARRAADGGELPAESYAASLVHTQVRIPHPRRVERLVLSLRLRDPGLGWPDFSGPGERVLAKSAGALTLEISRQHPSAAGAFPVAAADLDPQEREALAPNAYIQSDDPQIRAAAAAVVAGERDAMQAGLKLQRWVTATMRFDLGIVFAPSTEVFANRRGTCAGYAMLLTTLARAVGIPARYVLGYVYVDGIFGGHAWTEIKVGKDWIPIDAAIPADGPADAAHLAFLRSSLAEGIGSLATGPALQLFGHLDLDVLAVTVAGRPEWKVPAARPYALAGDAYRNTGLGLEMVKPAGFRFVGLDDVWPESRLVGLEGPAGERVALLRHGVNPGEAAEAVAWRRLDEQVPGGRHGRMDAAGRAAWLIEGSGAAALAWSDGDDLWVLAAEGAGAPALLRRVAATVKLPD